VKCPRDWVNSTWITGAHTSGPHVDGRALDIFRLNDVLVKDMMSSGTGVALAVRFVKAMWSVAPARSELIGPFGGWRMLGPGRPSTDNREWLQTLVTRGDVTKTLIGWHYNHFHFSVPSGWSWPK